MLGKILRFYSLWFRFGGLAMAILSGVVSLALGVGILHDGYVLVNGQPSKDLEPILMAVGKPLFGVVVGLALFYFVPRIR
jgi:hypothetical protein